MKSFQAKVGWKMMGKRENKKLSFRFVPTQRAIQNFKKIAKKFKKLKNTIMASFQAKYVGKCRERENIELSFCFVPTRRLIENSKKIGKKI